MVFEAMGQDKISYGGRTEREEGWSLNSKDLQNYDFEHSE